MGGGPGGGVGCSAGRGIMSAFGTLGRCAGGCDVGRLDCACASFAQLCCLVLGVAIRGDVAGEFAGEFAFASAAIACGVAGGLG